MKDSLQYLQKSPLFQLSLCSKELFYSNFLGWLWRTYPDVAFVAFEEVLHHVKPTSVPIKVSREKSNLDLTVTFEDGAAVVIENKVKSLPSAKQLSDYSGKFKDGDRIDFILLSPLSPGFADGDGDQRVELRLFGNRVWRWIGYDEVAERLQVQLPKISCVYDRSLVADFAGMARSLHRILISEARVEAGDNFFRDVDQQVKDLRLHDVVQKLRFSYLEKSVRQALLRKVTSGNWRNLQEERLIHTGVLMTHGVGLFDLKYTLAGKQDGDDSPPVLGLQIQGKSFRLVFEWHTHPVINMKSLADTFRDSWFNFDPIKPYVPEKVSGRSKLDEFKSFGNGRQKDVFIYLYRNIEEKITLEELTVIIVGYVATIERDFATLQAKLPLKRR